LCSPRRDSGAEDFIMADHSEVHSFVRTFCEALSSRDASKLRPMLADDVEWTVFGPVDYFPFFGPRKGKEAVVETMCNQVADHLRLVSCSPERMLVDGNKAASLVRVTAEHIPSGRTLAFRLAQFTKFKGGKLLEMRAILDSFDVVEQVMDATQTRIKNVACA
jgi:ketosteroid isomerase-like protein